MRELSTLRLRKLEHLYAQLATSKNELESLCESIERHVRRFDQEKNGKRRKIAEPIGRYKVILKNLNRALQRISLPDYIYGGRKGKSSIDNARRHIRKPMVFKADIKDCFPSIKSGRVYELFSERLACTPDIARILTRITTIDGALPQGYPTSTIIAVMITEPCARRLDSLASKHGADFSIFVDDVTLSGPRHLGRLETLVKKIGRQEGFVFHKIISMDESEEQHVTGVRVNTGLDAPKSKFQDISRLLEELSTKKTSDAEAEKRIGTARGKTGYIRRLNPGAAKQLARKIEKTTRAIIISRHEKSNPAVAEKQ